MGIVQTSHAPDLVSFGKDGDQDVVCLGTARVPITAATGSDITLSRADLRTLLKENYRIGWNNHILHMQTLDRMARAELRS